MEIGLRSMERPEQIVDFQCLFAFDACPPTRLPEIVDGVRQYSTVEGSARAVPQAFPGSSSKFRSFCYCCASLCVMYLRHERIVRTTHTQNCESVYSRFPVEQKLLDYVRTHPLGDDIDSRLGSTP